MQMYKNDPDTEMIKKLLVAPESEYMNEAQLVFFKERLIALHDSTREHIRQAKEQIMSPPDLSDISDRATWEEQCTLLMRIVDREQKLLPKIQQALERIRLGEYGYCLESGEPIGIERLLARPTAEYCADVKVFSEHKEHLYKKEREF
ncbi:TraR/DksA family transcriptional regulator [Pseudoalteromonas ruthenica]|uniref:TraR/DksA family transcriptional regulator n=1 Tax=Pseudoalteromonas ruthenica TaxID=151081 RepID=UPI001108A0E4|nr:TraR/DksA C4-type zinc finger protein [Pseudoalteromonas ruthenica]TLX49132.1 molecular chaperone DnaK [Pseudoalteromonas ruthenica]TMO43200.1 molecular chaperone DnaK [Pseudoalteromonas ruthenica]TMO50866.1 molecular chaperone DnaK [Pseudoalteromonas ruthenica]